MWEKENISYPQKKKKKGGKKEIALVRLLAFTQQNTTVFAIYKDWKILSKIISLWGHSSYQSNLIVFDSLLIWVDVVKMADVLNSI